MTQAGAGGGGIRGGPWGAIVLWIEGVVGSKRWTGVEVRDRRDEREKR